MCMCEWTEQEVVHKKKLDSRQYAAGVPVSAPNFPTETPTLRANKLSFKPSSAQTSIALMNDGIKQIKPGQSAYSLVDILPPRVEIVSGCLQEQTIVASVNLCRLILYSLPFTFLCD